MAYTAAEQAFDRLSQRQAAALARRVFDILEYDEDGNPGSEWSSNTTQALGELFASVDVTFTDPTDYADDDSLEG